MPEYIAPTPDPDVPQLPAVLHPIKLTAQKNPLKRSASVVESASKAGLSTPELPFPKHQDGNSNSTPAKLVRSASTVNSRSAKTPAQLVRSKSVLVS